MPTVALEIPETYDSVTRPVTTGIVKDLIDYFELPNDTNIRYLGTAGEAAQRGSQLAGARSGSSFPFTERVDVDLSETYLEDGVLTTAIKRHENNYIFLDKQLLVSLKPVYTKTEATITFRYRATNKTQAYKWRDTLRRRMSQGTQALLHELIYHYPTPPVFHAILREIHAKRENVAGYGEDFTAWLEKHYDHRMTVLSNLDGSRGAVAIPEKQIQVQGWLSFNDQPEEPEKEDDGDSWIVSFDYTVQYDKVTGMVMDYPIVVHNQLLDDKYLDLQEPYNPYNVKRKPSHSGRLNDTFSRINYNADTAFQGVSIPSFDDWKPAGSNYRTVPIFTSLIGVELGDPHQVVNLMELGETALSQSVTNFIFRHRSKIPHYQASAFHLTFYKGKMAVDPGAFYIDEDLNVRAHNPLDPRDIHHVRLSVMSDLRNLSPQGKDDLRKDPEVCIQVFDVLDGMQRPNLPFATTVGIHNTGDLQNRKGLWRSPVPSRPGFHLPSGDYSHIKPKSGNPTQLYPTTQQPSDQEKNEGRVWRPIEQTFDSIRSNPDYPTLQAWLEAGALPVLTTGMVEGVETMIVVLDGQLYEITVNHFLKSAITLVKRLGESDFDGYYQDTQYYWVNNEPSVVEYLEQLYLQESILVILQRSEVIQALLPGSTITIITTYGITKPTFQNSQPSRVTSPTRPGINGSMLSDELVILGGKVITKPSFELAVNHLKPEVNTSAVSQGQGMRTVMQAGIVVHGS